jgi:hypothetical protein
MGMETMNSIAIFYVLNATLLLLHEIESAYEKEWEILKLPGKITGFLLMHIPIILLLFYGLLAIERHMQVGMILGLVCGIGGVIPLLVHKLFARRSDRFNHLISDVLIYTNAVTGAVLAALVVSVLA